MMASGNGNSSAFSRSFSLRASLREKLALKFMLPTVIIMVVVTMVVGSILISVQVAQIRQRASDAAAEQTERVLDTLQSVDTLADENVHAAIRVLMHAGKQLGGPAVGPGRAMNGEEVPDLKLGGTSQVGNFELVDRAKDLVGGTETLFVRRGEDF